MPTVIENISPDEAGSVASAGPRMSAMGRLGWVAAIAACVIAGIAWIYRPMPRPLPARPTPSPIAEVTNDPRTVEIELEPQDTFAEQVSEASEVLWNQEQQQGLLRLAGVPENDPIREQYQLWIYDATRADFAVDGGVFDISAATERDEQGRPIVPFRPKLIVGDPTVFAVTREKPGGVVVTDSSGLILLGRPGGS